MTDTPTPPDGWYPDPAGGGGLRRWDGTSWTDEVRSVNGDAAASAHPDDGAPADADEPRAGVDSAAVVDQADSAPDDRTAPAHESAPNAGTATPLETRGFASDAYTASADDRASSASGTTAHEESAQITPPTPTVSSSDSHGGTGSADDVDPWAEAASPAPISPSEPAAPEPAVGGTPSERDEPSIDGPSTASPASADSSPSAPEHASPVAARESVTAEPPVGGGTPQAPVGGAAAVAAAAAAEAPSASSTGGAVPPAPAFRSAPAYPGAPAAASSAAPAYPGSSVAGAYPGAPSVGYAATPRRDINENTVWIWLLVALPLVGVLSLFLFDWGAFVRESVYNDLAGDSLAAPSTAGAVLTAVSSLLSLIISAATVVFALLDWRQLRARGIDRPFHWAWSFFVLVIGSGLVYIIGRSVIVRRQTGKGLAPLWAAIGVTVLTWIIASVWVVMLLTQIFSLVQELQYTYGY